MSSSASAVEPGHVAIVLNDVVVHRRRGGEGRGSALNVKGGRGGGQSRYVHRKGLQARGGGGADTRLPVN